MLVNLVIGIKGWRSYRIFWCPEAGPRKACGNVSCAILRSIVAGWTFKGMGRRGNVGSLHISTLMQRGRRTVNRLTRDFSLGFFSCCLRYVISCVVTNFCNLWGVPFILYELHLKILSRKSSAFWGCGCVIRHQMRYWQRVSCGLILPGLINLLGFAEMLVSGAWNPGLLQ
jgi:hypothetical protein